MAEENKGSVGASDLKACAEEMNRVMGLDPKIKTVAVKADALKEAIIANAIGDDGDGNINPEDGIQEADDFSTEAWNTLSEILDPDNEDHATVLAIANDKVAAAAATKSKTKTKEPKAEKPAKEPKEKKEKVAKEKKEKAPKEKKEKAPKVPKEKKERTGLTNKFSRSSALASVFKTGGSYTFDELADLSNKEYVKQGGGDCVAMAKRVVERCLPILNDLGYLTVDGKTFKLKK